MIATYIKIDKLFIFFGFGILVLFLFPLYANSQTVMFNGFEYTKSDGKWYMEDPAYRFEVIEDVISVKFKLNITLKQINELNVSMGTRIEYKSIGGFYILKLLDSSDPINATQQYLQSGLVEIAHPFTYGVLFSTPSSGNTGNTC